MLQERIALMCKRADEVTAAYWKASGFTHAAPPTHRADYISDKWCRIVTVENWPDQPPRDSSVYAFVALVDNYTRALGAVVAGNIHKAASFKAPAKHARGSVLAEDFNNCLTAHGIVYLK